MHKPTHSSVSTVYRIYFQLVDEEVFQSYLERSMRIAESRAADSYHCKTPDCQGWCLYEDNINKWTCGLCDKENCLTCKAIHQGKTCRQYQSQMENLAATDKQAQKTLAMIKVSIKVHIFLGFRTPICLD